MPPRSSTSLRWLLLIFLTIDLVAPSPTLLQVWQHWNTCKFGNALISAARQKVNSQYLQFLKDFHYYHTYSSGWKTSSTLTNWCLCFIWSNRVHKFFLKQRFELQQFWPKPVPLLDSKSEQSTSFVSNFLLDQLPRIIENLSVTAQISSWLKRIYFCHCLPFIDTLGLYVCRMLRGLSLTGEIPSNLLTSFQNMTRMYVPSYEHLESVVCDLLHFVQIRDFFPCCRHIHHLKH